MCDYARRVHNDDDDDDGKKKQKFSRSVGIMEIVLFEISHFKREQIRKCKKYILKSRSVFRLAVGPHQIGNAAQALMILDPHP